METGACSVGARTVATLTEHGLQTVRDGADLPAVTLQRLLGARLGRTLHERAHALDTSVVDPTPAPASTSAEHAFPRDELDPSPHRRALLALGCAREMPRLFCSRGDGRRLPLSCSPSARSRAWSSPSSWASSGPA
ncbi:hypothetical protein ACFV2U_24655 [Streptomyces sp. NPDC059697]|uniref:hypothetical protein n=1 Tax=Streptomyces sp. NPDC059697 TaxID=3346912 RepID=UPI003678AE18